MPTNKNKAIFPITSDKSSKKFNSNDYKWTKTVVKCAYGHCPFKEAPHTYHAKLLFSTQKSIYQIWQKQFSYCFFVDKSFLLKKQ